MPVQAKIALRDVTSGDDVKSINIARHAARLPSAISPTHVFERDGKVVGYGSVDAIPIFTGWLADDVNDADARDCIARLESAAKERGLSYVVFPCTKDCRFVKQMQALGYRKGKEVMLHLKLLKG